MSKIKISSLKELDYNPRIISDGCLKRLMQSIKEHTDTIPEKTGGYRLTTTITVNKQGNRIIGGHQRVKAIKALGQDWIHEDDITWVDIEPDSPKEKALNVTLNSENFSGDWDNKKLDKILDQIKKEDDDLLKRLTLVEIEIPKVEKIEIRENKPKEEKPQKEKTIIEMDEEDDDEGVIGVVNTLAPDEQLYPISYAVNKEHRELILEATKQAKSKFELKSNTEAIVKICEDFLKDK